MTRRALLCYSRFHFDPRRGTALTTSAGIIARSLFETLERGGYAVDYIDTDDAASVTPKGYDLFVGQPPGWVAAADRAAAAMNVLFMPTTDPRRRNRLLREAARRWRVPIEDTLSAEETSSALARADLVLQIGNEYAIRTLRDHGVPPEKIVHLHYGLPHITIGAAAKTRGSYLHLAASICLRKGSAEVLQLLGGPDAPPRLTLVGRTDHEPWRSKVAEALAAHPEWRHVPWLDSSGQEYLGILDTHEWLVFPTIEEAEPGTVLEAMSRQV